MRSSSSGLMKLQKNPRTLPAVAGLELAAHEALDQEPVAEEGAELGQHQASIFHQDGRMPRTPGAPAGRGR